MLRVAKKRLAMKKMLNLVSLEHAGTFIWNIQMNSIRIDFSPFWVI